MLCACPSGKLVDYTHSFVSQTDSLSSLPRCTRATRVLRAILVSNTWRNWPNVNVRSTTDTISSFIPGLLYVSRQCPRAWEWDHITPSLIPRLSLKSLGMGPYHFQPHSQALLKGLRMRLHLSRETMCVISTSFHRLCNHLPPQVYRLPP